MASVTFRRSTSLAGKMDSILTEAGYVSISSSPFLGSLMGAIKDTLDIEYSNIYDVVENIDLGRAEGAYLDRWGNFLNEPREKLSFATDLTLTNTRILIDPTALAGSIMLNSTGIPIPKGTQIFSEDMRYGVETIDNVTIRPDRSDAYCRVVCITPGTAYIPSASLTRVNLSLTDITGVLPSAISKYSLTASNSQPITGGTTNATDEQYRYILLKKAESIGLFNESKINSMLDIDEVVQISIKEYRGGVSVFVETKYYENSQIIVDMLRMGLKSAYVKGMNITVFPPVYRNFTGTISLGLKKSDPTLATHAAFKTEFCRLMNAIPMGGNISLSSMLESARMINTNILTATMTKASYNYREILNPKSQFGQQFNEKLLTSLDRMTVI